MTTDEEIQINEYETVELPAIELLKKLGFEYLDGRRIKKEVQHFFLFDVLEQQIKKLNPWISEINLHKVVKEITNIQATSPIEANQEFYYKIVNYLSVKQDLGHGKKNQTVKIIDWDNIDNNKFQVVNQFSIKNSDWEIIPDIVIFVNGIPISIIECKSPNIEEPIDQAISQLFGYREKNEKFFYPNQLLVALARFEAKYSSTFSPAKFFFDWKIPHPKDEEQLKILLKKDTLPPQDILLYSLFRKENILDIIRNYIVFESEDNQTIKKVARYNQYIASNKIINNLKDKKGGVIWHTQGSGKSLTMTFTAQKIRRIERIEKTHIENPCVLIVTDRTDLDDQISKTFQNCKFPNPIPVTSVKHLKEELSNPQGKTLFTTIQKFLTRKGEVFPELSVSSNIIVFTDEAHRTNNGDLALNMRTAIPNALFIGFTGTPIDKKDKSTKRVFGGYIDKYLPRQSIKDGATVEIKYQPRLERVHIKSSELDLDFDETFDEYSDKEKELIKKKYGRYRAIAEDEQRVRDICKDIVEHYKTTVLPEGFKAQIVVTSRESAVTCYKILKELDAPRTEVIISGSHKDAPKSELRKHYKTKAQQRAILKEFRKEIVNPKEDLCFLVVCDMLLTGFDAPIEQVMYLDKPLREHNLMQAVARVNRPHTENKTHGLIIDYCGISKRLKEALEIFNDGDLTGYLEPLMDNIPKAEQSLNKVKRFFEKIKTSKADEYIDKCVLDVLDAKDTRIRFEKAFKEFSMYVNSIIPNPKANKFKKDLMLFGKIYNSMRLNYDEKTPSVLDASIKVKELIHKHLKSEGIEVLHEPLSIYSSEFNDLVGKKKSDRAKASIIEHKVRTTISNLYPTNPVFYTSLRERLEKIITDREESMIDDVRVLSELNELKDNLDPEEQAKSHKMEKEEFAIYQMIREEFIQTNSTNLKLTAEQEELLNDITKSVFNDVSELADIDWKQKKDLQNQMRKVIKRPLMIKLKLDVDQAESLSVNIMNLLRNLL